MRIALSALLIGATSFGGLPQAKIAGRIQLTAADSARWNWAGAWIFPVGDPVALSAADARAGEFHLLRGLGARPGGHQGADLGNGQGGDEVCAAADGIVGFVARDGWQSGYGRHVVIVHRLADGTLVYSVYAHLKKQSILVHAGDGVGAGDRIARVGRSGRASTEHLHFEIRRPEDVFDRWENQPVIDPVAFVGDRLPAHRADSSWAAPYLAWADRCGLIDAASFPGDALTRHDWWRMLARAARHPAAVIPAAPDSLRALLIAIDMLPPNAPNQPDAIVGWKEMQRDLRELARGGVRICAPRMPLEGHRQLRESRLGMTASGGSQGSIHGSAGVPPTLADACFATADLTLSLAQRPGNQPPRRH